MKISILLFSLLLIASSFCDDNKTESKNESQPVISRNERIQEMIDGLQVQNEFYEEMINSTMKTLKGENEECKKRINELNCSNVEVWENLRKKHSKNITNLQDKMKKHNETIHQILRVNKELVEKKNASLMQLFPEVKKIKNDQEMIDIMLMVIDDTYVRVEEIDMEPNEENSSAAVFILSEMEKELKEVGKFIQMRREGPPPETQTETNETIFTNETTTTSNETIFSNETTQESNETFFTEEGNESNETNETEEDLPLIDEEIFDKESQQGEVKDEDLFSKEEKEKEEEEEPLIADDIPEGKDVKEHDEQHLEKVAQRNQSTEQNKTNGIIEHYDLKQLKLSLIERVKIQGKEMFKELSALRKELKIEQEEKLEEISAYERAIFLIHQKHMHEIVQIYKENRNLYVQILEKDDAVMQLDSKINECRNIQEYEQSCEDVKDSLQQFAEDSKSQINFNNAAIKELEKLLEYEDKNVFDPAYDEQQQSTVTPAQGPMHFYEDYSSADDGELVKRTVVCKVTECREKRYQSEEKFNLLLTNKYESFDEDQLLKETQIQEEKGTKLDERFEIKEKNDDEIQEAQQQKVQPVKKEIHPLQIENLSPPEELTPLTDDTLITEMKDKLSSDVGGPKEDNKPEQKSETKAQLEQQKTKKKLNKKHSQAIKLKKNEKKAQNDTNDKELAEPKEVKTDEEKKEDSNIFKQAFHYLFGSKNTQGFTEIREEVHKNVNGPLDFLAQLN